jgi:DNA-binding transcriptional regulator PaaX
MERSQKINYKEVILRTLYVGGVLSLAILAPNALQMIKQIKKNGTVRNLSNQQYYIKSKLPQLEQNGYVRFDKQKHSKVISLTKKGEQELQKYLLSDLKIKKPKKWDGKWRIVTFDVVIGKNKLRNLLRLHLKRLGFIQFQKSIWILPYECEEIIVLLKSHLKFGKEVLYARVEYIEGDVFLKKQFNIS